MIADRSKLITSLAADVRECYGSAATKAVVALLREIEHHHLERLATISVDDLHKTQGKLAQTIALRKLLEGEAHTNGIA